MRKSFQVLFLILIVSSSFVFAQTDDKPQAVKYDEFGNLYNGDMKARFDGFSNELNNDPTAKGLIVIYGKVNESLIKEKFFKQYIRFRRFDDSRIEIIKAGHRNEIMTQFWLVPAGAENPKIDETAYKIEEFGKATIGDIKARMDAFFVELDGKKDSQGYIFNYGTPKEIAAREKLVKNTITFRRFDSARITIVRGGKGNGLNTILWIVPEGTEIPKP